MKAVWPLSAIKPLCGLAVVLSALASDALAGRCNPVGRCTACTTCSACQHCSKNGGTCSVCRAKITQSGIDKTTGKSTPKR